MNWSDNINKRLFWRYVNKKLNHIIHHAHVFSVITILFEEMVQDLKDGKEIKIHNFGTFALQSTKPRRHFNVLLQKIVQSKSHRILRFKLVPRIQKKLRSFLDIDKSFNSD
jgi:nucleoid DNA-binding protein